jgi:leucyl/phenylalanyl-tRNA---protein transferase
VTAPQITWISPADPPGTFPELAKALRSPNGLLAAGGDLSPERLLHAYEHAIFPWFDDHQPILWWSPDPRCVLFPPELHLARRFKRDLGKSPIQVSFNRSFGEVITACGRPRQQHAGTWITPGMIEAYNALHQLGWAHSVEVWLEDRLVGGMYGVAIGRAFFGESMFSRLSNASKIALLALSQHLVKHDFAVLDCQVSSPHLMSLGAIEMPRRKFASLLENCCTPRTAFTDWPVEPLDAARLRSVQLQCR